MSSRRSQFKKGIDADACRRGRRDTTIQLRKGKKEDQMQKRRMGMAESNLKSDTMHKNEDMPTSAISSLSSSKAQVTVADLPRIMPIISNPASTNETLVPAIADLRRILSVERNPPVNEVIDAGAVPHLVRIMATKHDCWEAVFEAAWAITNIGSTDRTAELVHCDAVQPLILLLKHNMPEIREQAAWALGNIAGDCPEFRDMVINGGALDGLILNVNEPANMSLLGNVVWTLSNLCRGKPATALEQIQCVVAPLANLFSKPVSEDVLADVAWALSYVSDGNDDRINLVVQSGVIQPFVQCLATASTGLLTPVLRTLGNCVTGNDVQTQAVIDAGVLGCMQPILESQKKNIRKEACWLLSNIAAGTQEQIGQLITQQGLMGKTVNYAIDAPHEIRKEALWCLSNIATTGTTQQVQALVQLGAIEAFCFNLEEGLSDPSMIMVILNAIDKILQVSLETGMDYLRIVDEYNGIDCIENLQEHPNDEVYNKAVYILENYFGGDEEEDENLAPDIIDGGYTFGVPKQLFPDTQAPAFDFGGSPMAFGESSTNNQTFEANFVTQV